jgi:Protein kinase domain
MENVKAELATKRPPKEPGVQALWNALAALIPVQGIVWDCTKPNGIEFAGRSHEIDLVLFFGNIRAMEYVDTPMELKQQITTDGGRRKVVLQLLDRIKFVFDAQPARQVCWGVGLDAQNALFVRCDRSLQYGVTPTCSLWNRGGIGQLLFDFLGAPAAVRGFIPVKLPELWGNVAAGLLSSSSHACVYRLCNERAAKVGHGDIITAEWTIVDYLQSASAPGLLAPRSYAVAELMTQNVTWPCGYQMDLHAVVSVSTEEELCASVGAIFWRLGVLHALGIVHNDVKPSNMLQTSDGERLLCDFGNAIRWKEGDAMVNQRGATELFSVVPGAFVASDTSMFACDVEGLFWTALCLWFKVIETRDSVPRLNAAQRFTNMLWLGVEGGVCLNGNVQLIVPRARLLARYFEQAKGRVLKEPLKLFRSFVELFDGGETAAWMAKVSQLIEAEGLFPCPAAILGWVWDHMVRTKE